jgi:MFS family permease
MQESEFKITDRGRFWKIAGAGAAFQAGSAAVDSATVVASLVFQLTGSAFAVGAASAILRLGWLLPQLVVGFLAECSTRRMPFYVFGAYGRAICAGLIALLLWTGTGLSPVMLATGFLILWTLYAFVSGVVAVPYNDIVGRSIPSGARSRMLAWRFFGGGILALGVAVFVRQVLETTQSMFQGYALIFALASVLMLLSSTLFVSAGEPIIAAQEPSERRKGLVADFFRNGWVILQGDARFRLFLFSQWLGGATLMALPFYVVAASTYGIGAADVGLLLGAQTVGSLFSNAFWGRLGDRAGKLRLLQTVGVLRLFPPIGVLLLLFFADTGVLVGFVLLFIVIGALMSGMTIGYLGYLMEISPDDRRPAYSAYFNALASPAALLPLLGAALIEYISINAVFVAAVVAAAWQLALLNRISRIQGG